MVGCCNGTTKRDDAKPDLAGARIPSRNLPIMGRSLFAFARRALGTWNEHAAIYRVHRAGPRVI